MSAKPFMRALLGAALGIALVPAAPAMAQVVKYETGPKDRILQGAEVKAGTDLFFLSGQLASPIDPKKSFMDVKSVDDLGDTLRVDGFGAFGHGECGGEMVLAGGIA